MKRKFGHTVPVDRHTQQYVTDVVIPDLLRFTDESIELVVSNNVALRILRLIRSTPFRSLETTRLALDANNQDVISFILAYNASTTSTDTEAMCALQRIAATGNFDKLPVLG